MWVFTFGKLKFWLLPNLTEDCGFKESFIPVYEYEFDSGQSIEKGIGNDGNENGAEVESKSNEPEKVGSDMEKIPSTMENDGKLEDEKDDGSENNSGSNKDPDDWVKVSKTDAAENPNAHEIRC